MEGNTINDKTKIEVMKRKMMKKSRGSHKQECRLRVSASWNNLIKTVNHVGQFWKDLDEKVLAVVKNNDTEEGADITSDFAHLGSKFLNWGA